MTELIKNPISGDWVAYAESRASRPTLYKDCGLDYSGIVECPFCLNNTHMVGTPIIASEDNRVRIIPNKYPILTTESLDGYGIHDVVIDTDLHDEKLHNFNEKDIETLLKALKQRKIQLASDEKIKYVQIFKNQGVNAGASQEHSHCQIVALPVIPSIQMNSYKNLLEYYRDNNSCYYCDNIVRNNEFIFYENESFVAYCDVVSMFSYEIKIAPKKHISLFEGIEDKDLIYLASILKKCLMALYVVYDELDYNICFMDSFTNIELENLYECTHFHIQIIPRRGRYGGFELSTGTNINSYPPKKTANRLGEIMNAI